MTKDRKISICVFLSGFSCFAQLYYFQPLLPDLAQEFGLSASYSSLAISFSTLGMVVGLFTAMFVADSISRKKLISAALLSSAVFSVICSYSPSFFLLVALSALKGFLLSGATSVSLAYISEEVQPRNKGKITGLYIAGNALGGMGGRVISSYLSSEFSWRIASVSIGVLCALFAISFLIQSPFCQFQAQTGKFQIIDRFQPSLDRLRETDPLLSDRLPHVRDIREPVQLPRFLSDKRTV